MPDTIDKALNMAIVATNADREDRTSRKYRGVNKRVYAVGGIREDVGFRKEDRPQSIQCVNCGLMGPSRRGCPREGKRGI